MINEVEIKFNNIKILNNYSQISHSLRKENERFKTRYYILDNYKGILIFLVVFAHLLIGYSNNKKSSSLLIRKIIVFIYSFHMPAFIFISGLLSSENSTKFSNAIKLIILYYIFNYTQALFLFLYIKKQISFLEPSLSCWYLLSLFFWRISIKFLNKIKFIFIISIIVNLLEGYWECFNNILSVVRTIAFYPFFLAGYKISSLNLLRKFLAWRKGILNYILAFFSFISFVIAFSIYIDKNNIINEVFLMVSYKKNNQVNDRAFIMLIASLMIFFNILLIPNFKIPLISKMGRNSLYIYLFHRVITIIIQVEYLNHIYNSLYVIGNSFILSFLISLIFGSDFISKVGNSSLNSIHKNILESNNKGNIIKFIFSLYFILLLLIKPINQFINT